MKERGTKSLATDLTNNYDYEDEDLLSLKFETGEEVQCGIVGVFPVGDKDYIALLPIKSDIDFEEGQVFLFGYKAMEDDGFELIDIETDEEFERVEEAFDEFLDEEAFNTMEDSEES